jgi:hypothetical protein
MLRNPAEIPRNLAMRRASQTWPRGSLIAQLFLALARSVAVADKESRLRGEQLVVEDPIQGDRT